MHRDQRVCINSGAVRCLLKRVYFPSLQSRFIVQALYSGTLEGLFTHFPSNLPLPGCCRGSPASVRKRFRRRACPASHKSIGGLFPGSSGYCVSKIYRLCQHGAVLVQRLHRFERIRGCLLFRDGTTSASSFRAARQGQGVRQHSTRCSHHR